MDGLRVAKRMRVTLAAMHVCRAVIQPSHHFVTEVLIEVRMLEVSSKELPGSTGARTGEPNQTYQGGSFRDPECF